MSRWDGLSPRERAELMALFAREGVTDVRRMRTIYDEGGDIKPAVVDADYPRMKETLDLVNSSDANFVSRLKDVNRRTIPDWEVKGNVATHKLGWTTMDGKAYVYPLVQEIDGELYDFTDPKYGFDDYDKAAIDHALSTGDYVAMPKESDARWFTESYKNHYPTFNKYSGGGDKSGDSEVMVRLGEDDYLHQGELDPAVVVAESKKPMTYIPREMFNIVKDKPASEEEMALRKVVDSLVRKDKPTPLTILDNYRSAYRNPFIVNPFNSVNHVNRFADGGDSDTWKPWYWFTPEYDGGTLKEAIFRAYDDGRKGKNIIHNKKAYKAILSDKDEIEYANRDQHEENKKITDGQVVDSYIDNVMWTMENPHNKGLGKDGLYRPYADSSSPKNIGPGINITSDEGVGLDFSGKTGYTKEFLNDHIRPFLNKKMNRITDDLHVMRGDDADTLSLGNRMIFLDIAHNVSPHDNKRANMPSYWKKLTKAMFDGDLKGIQKETDSGSVRRQKMRNDLIWKNYIDKNTVKNR